MEAMSRAAAVARVRKRILLFWGFGSSGCGGCWNGIFEFVIGGILTLQVVVRASL